MSRSILIVLAVWAVGYLAALGSSELRSEEGHRVIPAVEMLESGDYLVPHIGGQPYLRKPPLINWLIAGSFKMLSRAQRMGGADALRPLRSGGGNLLRPRHTPHSRRARVGDRCTLLADKSRNA